MRGTLLIVSLTLFVAACGEAVVVSPGEGGLLPGGSVTATALAAEAPPAGIVQVRFESTGTERYWFNPCNRSVERLEGSRWVALPPELRICTAEIYLLDAGSARTESTDVPADASPGTYQFVFPMSADRVDATPVAVRSTPFTVR
jgi:hypothetical protein